MKNKAFFYTLSFTWGIIMTLIGLILACVLICMGYKPKRWGGCLYFNVGENWGGVELGIVFITDKRDREYVKNHEFGHAIQNCRYGVLMPFLVCVPSAIRFWWRKMKKKKGLKNKTGYYDIWFEAEATRLGEKYIKCW